MQQEDSSVKKDSKPGLQFNLNTFLNLVIMLGLIFIYVLFFTDEKVQESEKATKENLKTVTSDNLRIAFVNTDTLREKYILTRKLSNQLSSRYKSLEANFNAKQKDLQKKAKSLQNRYELNLISEADAQLEQAKLEAEGQKLYKLNQEYTNQLAEEEYKINMTYVDSVLNYIKRINEEYDFDYILSFTKGQNILFAKDTLNITNMVIEGLNKEYYEKHPEEKEEE